MTESIVSRFGGLNLRDDPQEVGPDAAIDVNNVDLLDGGRFSTRDGYTQWTTGSAESTVVQFLARDRTTATPRLIGSVGADLVVWDDDGSVFARQAAVSAGGYGAVSAASVSGASNRGVYIPVIDGQVWKWDGAVFSDPLIGSSWSQVAAWKDRLVQAGSRDFLRFSDPDDIDTEATYAANTIAVGKGDGESIVGMRVWRELLFAFKSSKFYVFYDVSTDTTGGAIFNYRAVETGVGLWGKRAVETGAIFPANTLNTNPSVAASDALYFLGRDGIYRTTGGPPELISRQLDPLFLGGADLVLQPETRAYMEEFGSLIITSISTTTGYRQIVYNRATNSFTVYDLPAGPLCRQEFTAGTRELMFGGSTTKHIYRHSSAQTTDAGAAIAWRYQSGWYDLGSPNSKRVGPLSAWGSGTVTASLLTDHGTTDDSASALTLGTAPAVARTVQPKTRRGRLFSHKLSGSGQAEVHGLGVTVRDQRAQ